MEQTLTQKEIEWVRDLCFNNPVKSCAFAQEIINVCGIVSCSEYSETTEIPKRNVNHNVQQCMYS